MPHPTPLTAVIASYPHTRAIKAGAMTSPEVTLDFTEIEPINKVFAPMVRRQAYEMTELAIVTALQAIAYGKPIVLLPAVVASRMQRGCIIALADRGLTDPASLRGKRVGVRAYTQTTGMWVRCALREDAGLEIDDINWVTHDPAHVEEYHDPAFVQHDETGKSLLDQLRDGDIDAAVLGNDLPKSAEFAPVIPGHRARDEAWVADHGFMPTNHVIAVTREAFDTKPDAVRAAYHLFQRAAAEAGDLGAATSVAAFGIDTLQDRLAYIIEECCRQHLLARPLSVDELLAPAAALLTVPGSEAGQSCPDDRGEAPC